MSTVRKHKARLGGAVKAGNRELENEARAALKLAVAEDYVRRLVDAAPLLTAEQRGKLAVLLLCGREAA